MGEKLGIPLGRGTDKKDAVWFTDCTITQGRNIWTTKNKEAEWSKEQKESSKQKGYQVADIYRVSQAQTTKYNVEDIMCTLNANLFQTFGILAHAPARWLLDVPHKWLTSYDLQEACWEPLSRYP